MNFLERMVINAMLKNFVKDFINKYPKQYHYAAVIMTALCAYYAESPALRADVATVINSLPHHSQWVPIAALLIKLLYTDPKK
jgi:hypothetical protein